MTTLIDTFSVLAMAPPPAGTQPNPTGQMLNMLGMFAMFGVVFYFIAIRPQRQQAKKHEALLKSLKAGDKVVTTSGIVGVVVGLKDKTVTLRSADTKLEILKSAVADVTERDGETAGA